MDKDYIINQIKPETREQAIQDYQRLLVGNHKRLSKKGNIFIDYFTFRQRLSTIGNKGLSYWDFIKNETYYPCCIRLMEWYARERPNCNRFKVLYNIFKLYYGPINSFRPVLAMDIYDRYKPTCVLDPTMGWGGRLVGASAYGIKKYIGIDLNVELEEPYNDMLRTLEELGSQTEVQLFFQDCLTIDYSALEYDMVFTSPPYFNLELYNGSNMRTKKEWIEDFYRPIFQQTYNGLSSGGHYIINVPISIFEEVLYPLFGEPVERIPMTTKRKATYREFIYVWIKG